MAQALRRRGHTVWLANLNEQNKLAWHDGEQVVAETAGPTPIGPLASRIPLIRVAIRRVKFILFLLRIRAFANSCGADIVQVDPGGQSFMWLLPLRKSPGVLFILDIRHINRGIRTDLYGRFREELVIFSQGIVGKYFYDRTFFNHQNTAETIFGENWRQWGDVVPVGIRKDFLKVEPDASDISDPSNPVLFIYLGAISKFRELEYLFQAAQNAMMQTDRFYIRLIGPDVAGGYYHRLIETMGIGAVVGIDPPIPNDEVPNVMATHHVGLAYTPNRKTWDYQPTIKVLEYRALGLPILSIDVVTHREVVEDGVNGLLVPHTLEAMTEGLVRFATDRAFLASAMKRAQQMRTAITLEDIGTMYDEIYESLSKKPEPLGFTQSGQPPLF